MNLSRLMTGITIAGAGISAGALFVSIDLGLYIYFRYFLIVVLAFWLVAIFLPTDFKINFVIFLVATGLSLMAAEVILELVKNSEDFESAARKNGVPFDSRTSFQVVVDLRNAGIDATAAGRFTGRIDVDGQFIFPIGGISNITTVLCNESGSHMIYEADEHGFNNPPDLWNGQQIEIAATGDSFTAGACVNPARNAVALVREVYGGTLNLGKAGFGPLTQLASIQEYLPEIKPETVLWFYYEGNDLDDLLQEMGPRSVNDDSVWSLTNYLDIEYSQDLIAKQDEIDRAIAVSADRLINAGTAEKHTVIAPQTLPGVLTLRKLRHMVAVWYIGRQPKECRVIPDTLLDFQRALTVARMSVNSWGGELIFVYLPSYERYSEGKGGPCPATVPNVDYYDQIVLIAENIGLQLIDIKSAIDQHPDPLSLWPYRLSGHFNEAGYRLVADEVLRSLPPRK